eukprot:GHVN01000893.1.p1 GENE.GHVN01000893.1~~GHVN01000893.1.p1  ORF type:complete len:670 (+),score=44.31 GHVN01000893.1:57-2066(+)
MKFLNCRGQIRLTTLTVLTIATVQFNPVSVSAFWGSRVLHPGARWSSVGDLGLHGIRGEVAAFGDYNSDKLVDVFYITELPGGGKALSVFLWEPSSKTFKFLSSVETSSRTVSLVPTDWNHDGRLDVFVIESNARHVSSPHLTKYTFAAYAQNYSTGVLERKFEMSPDDASRVDFFVCDINQDGRPDLVGENQNKERIVWINNSIDEHEAEHHSEKLFTRVTWSSLVGSHLMDDPLESSGGWPTSLKPAYAPFGNPHSSAFVDVNGDCKPDLVLVVEYSDSKGLLVEFWLNEHSDGRSFYRRDRSKDIILPAGSGQVLFADLNADGTVDIAFPLCSQGSHGCTESRILMSANKQVPLCKGIWNDEEEEDCRSERNLCVASEFQFSNFTASAQDFSVSELSGPLTQDIQFSGDSQYPITLKAGDYDADGFPDILALVTTAGEKVAMAILRNEEVSPSTMTTGRLRTFVLTDVLYSEEGDPYEAAFFDSHEDGVLDAFIFSMYGTEHESKHSTVRVMKPSIDSDVLFLKATGLNGVCVKSCPPPSPRFPDPQPYGVSSHGNVFKITVTDINGFKTARTACQLPQSAHRPMGLPFAFFGLGRTNNYIEEFYFGLASQSFESSNLWISIIPNTQVIAIPYRLEHPREWSLELSVEPSKSFFAILVVSPSCDAE